MPPPLPAIRDFRRRIALLLKSWRRGEFVSALLRIALVTLAALAALAGLDYFLASSDTLRQFLLVALVAVFIAAVVLAFARTRRLDHAQLARRADALGGGRRRPVLSALELLGEKNGPPGLHEYLVNRSVDEANESLGKVADRDVRPRAEIRKRSLRFFVAASVVALCAVFLWPVVSVLLARTLNPWTDIPPYSPLTFAVEPVTPEIFYGEDATVTVEIDGGEITEPVRFLARRDDEIFETVCFQDGPNRFAQRLERVVRPTEFAFAHGRARSEWHDIELLLEPKVALASVTITPPAYAELPPRTFLVGEEPLAGLRGSRVKLSVTSNRPLSSGDLEITPVGGNPMSGKGVAGERTGPQTTTFEWELETEADLAVAIRDVRGTPNRDPVKIAQKVVPDQPPTIAMDQPALHLMATPSIGVPIKARIEDDLGLSRVELVRTVAGYRDRMTDISPPSLGERFDFDSGLDLASLGVAPGEILELYLQAIDRNPSLLGVAASEVARIQIISDEEYANLIRTKTTLKEFQERFRVVSDAMSGLREKLREIEEAKKAGDTAAESTAREDAARSAAEAAKLFEMLAGDFAAFDLEQAAIDQAQKTLQTIQDIEIRLAPGKGELTDARLADMLAALGAQQETFDQQKKDAEEAVAVARVMEMATRFARLTQEQDILTRRMKKFEAETRGADVPFLKALGEDQKELEQRLEDYAGELGERIRDLPSGYDDLATDASKFLAEVEKAKVVDDMTTAQRAAGNENGGEAFQYSSLALEKMNALMQGDQDENFTDLADGELGYPCPGGLRQTLSQMLSAMCMKSGQGPGDHPGFNPGGTGGGGMGMGGDTNDGYSMAGYTALDIPVIGPPRMRLQDLPSRVSELADAGDSAAGKQLPGSASETDVLENTDRTAAAGSPMELDRVPEKYRDAVKRYFTPGKIETTSNPEAES